MIKSTIKNVAVIVAHPDDETLWAGGTILSHPLWNCFIVCLSRKNDPDRSAKFYKALHVYKCLGIMNDLDDEPAQTPLDDQAVQRAILELLPDKHFDLIISHSPSGEYTRHLRHEETAKAVINLWHSGKIIADELWAFAFQDGNKTFYPRAVENADIFRPLIKSIWLKKYNLITETYGFEKHSWEAVTTPQAEAFWQFTDHCIAKKWLDQFEI